MRIQKCICLILCALLLLAGCSDPEPMTQEQYEVLEGIFSEKEPTQTQQTDADTTQQPDTEPTQQTDSDTTQQTDAAATQQTQAPADNDPPEIKPTQQTDGNQNPSMTVPPLVEDAWFSIPTFSDLSEPCSYSIPYINLASAEIDALNAQIQKDFQYIRNHIESGKHTAPDTLGVSYEWSVHNDILSIVIREDFRSFDFPLYTIYNIRISDEKLANRDQVLTQAGMSYSEYAQIVRQGLGCTFWDNHQFLYTNHYTTQYYNRVNEHLSSTISDQNVQAATPFFNRFGQLSVLGKYYVEAGGGEVPFIFNLNDVNMSRVFEKFVTAPGSTMYVANVKHSIYFRSEPKERESNIITTILLGQPVRYIADENSVFSLIEYNGTLGYVKKEYLSAYYVNSIPTAGVKMRVANVPHSIYFRSSAAERDDNIICTILLGEEVLYIADNPGDFCLVEYEGMRGYVKDKYLSY